MSIKKVKYDPYHDVEIKDDIDLPLPLALKLALAGQVLGSLF